MSSRKSTRPMSVGKLVGVLFSTVRFQLLIPGVVTAPKVEFPEVPYGAATKQEVLNQWKRLRPPGTLFGLQILLGSPQSSMPVPEKSGLLTSNGAPLENSVMPLKDQPLTTLSRAELSEPPKRFPFPNGS